MYENITDQMTSSDSMGRTIHSLKEDSVSHRKFWFTKTGNNGEFVIPANGWIEFSLGALPKGFGPTTDGDAAKTTNAVDRSLPPSTHRHLNKGTIGSQAKLYSSPVATVGANSFSQNFVFSFMEAGQEHSGSFGVSSGDWRNSYGLYTDLYATILHTKSSVDCRNSYRERYKTTLNKKSSTHKKHN